MFTGRPYKRIVQRALALLLMAALVFLPLMAIALEDNSEPATSIAADSNTLKEDETALPEEPEEPDSPKKPEELGEPESPGEPEEPKEPDSAEEPETPEASGETNNFVYDEQPQALEDVQACIDSYNRQVLAATESEGEQAVLSIPKPRWEFMVEDGLMPEGYYCGLVEDDEEFGAEYYTFFEEEPSLRAAMAQDEDGYYLIKTPADLDAMRNILDGKYRLAQNINLSGYVSSTSTAAQGWQGIGTDARPFTGELDGQSYTISGLRSSYPAAIGVGLFRYAKNAYIHDLNLVTDTNGSGNALSASYKLGVLVGSMDNTVVESCTVEVNGGLSVGNYALGGVAGVADDHSTIRNCKVVYNQTIFGKADVGGIVGNAGDGTVIENCTVEGGPLTAAGRLGGIAGTSNAIAATTAAVGRGNVAQVVIKNCQVDGKGQTYSGTGNYISGLVGASFNTSVSGSTVENLTLSGGSYTAGLVGKLSANSILEDCHVDNATVDGSAMYTGGAVGYTYLGTGVQINNCTVQNTTILGGTFKTGGLVGLAESNARIFNCHVWNVKVQGKEEVGGLVGKLWYDASIHSSSVRSFTVEGGAGGMTGGLVGEHLGTSQIWDSYVMDGVVTGVTIDTGGFTGKSYGSTVIQNCFSEADVVYRGTSAGLALVGGFSGKLDGTAKITNCYATGNVRIETNATNLEGIGSFTGAMFTRPTVTNCYATGTIYLRNPQQKTVGGFTGHASPYTTLTNCYFDTTTTTRQYGVGNATVGGGTNPAGVTPLTTRQMVAGAGTNGSYIRFAYQNTQTQNGSQSNPWYIDPGLTYPYLYYQYNGLPKQETAYGLGAITYNNGAYLTNSRMDFTIEGTVPFRVTSDGAAWAYFPFADSSMHPVSQSAAADVPSTSYTPGSNRHSIGGISQSGIVGFASVPIATKTSNRPVWQDAQPGTYTYVGDLVTYTVKAKNYSAVYNWHDVVLQDPLPNGVSLQEDLDVTLRYTEGGAKTPLPKGEPGDSLPFYQYNSATRTLSVYLDSPLYNTETGGEPTEAYIEYTALVGREAVTQFNPNGTWNGDNIRNRGTVTGTLKTTGGTPMQTFTAPFDDRNIDPVYDKYIVTYISNYDMNGTVGADDVQVVGGYYLTDGSESHVVWANDDSPGHSSYTGFALTGYNFAGWYHILEDGTRVDVAPGDVLAHVSSDIFLFADWKITGAEFNFYKVNGEREPLADAVFVLYQWQGAGPPGDTELVTDASVASGNWIQVGEYISQVVSPGNQGLPITLLFSETGIFQMLEKTAPSGYQPQAGQWRFTATVEEENTALTGPSYIRAPPPYGTIRNPLWDDGTKWIFENHRIVPFAFIKISAPLLDKPQPYAVALEGAAFILYIWADPNTQPDSNALVTEQSIADGQWLEYAQAVSDGNGDVAFPLSDYAATYQLVEVAAPEFYQLTAGQWRFSVSSGDTIDEIAGTIAAIAGPTGEIPPAFKVINATELGGDFAGNLALVNFPDYSLPAMGGGGVPMFLFTGSLMIALGFVLLMLRKARIIAAKQRRYINKMALIKGEDGKWKPRTTDTAHTPTTNPKRR